RHGTDGPALQAPTELRGHPPALLDDRPDAGRRAVRRAHAGGARGAAGEVARGGMCTAALAVPRRHVGGGLGLPPAGDGRGRVTRRGAARGPDPCDWAPRRMAHAAAAGHGAAARVSPRRTPRASGAPPGRRPAAHAAELLPLLTRRAGAPRAV